MSCRHVSNLPHPDNVCLDCECLAPEKCIEHGRHAGHEVQIKEYTDGSGRYWCVTCNAWAWEVK